MMLNLARGVVDSGVPLDLVVANSTGPFRNLVPREAVFIDLGADRVLGALPGLVRYLRRRRPQTLLAAMDHANIVALWARALARVPTQVCVSVRSTLSQEALNAPSLSGRWMPHLARMFYPSARAVIAVSKGVADDLARLMGPGRTRLVVLPNPVVTPDLLQLAAEEPEHPWLVPGNSPVILAAGRLVRQKDYPTLIRAFAPLAESSDLRLVILGEGPERPALEALIGELGLTGRVDLPGFRENPFSCMARARLFVLSSAWEGLPGVLIQAMACGTPVVSTDCPSGPREILFGGRLGPLVPVGDVDALTKAMKCTLEAPPAPEVLQSRAADFDLASVTQLYLDVLGVSRSSGDWM